MKSKIITLLRSRGDYVSGQELCESFGVSRTAVWKAMGQLKKEGYRIDAVKNRGYKLMEDEAEAVSDVYSASELRSRIRTEKMGRELHFFEQIGSTNVYAKQLADQGAPEGTLVAADMQTAGKGRRGRAWDSPLGTNIYFTLVLKPDIAPDKASMLTIVMAHSVAKVIAGLMPEAKVAIKWPNDIVVGGRKICGILTEMSLEMDTISHVVIGVGINVHRQEFAPEIAPKATTLEDEGMQNISRSLILAGIMAQFEEDYRVFLEHEDLTGLLAEYNAMLVNMDREVLVLDPKGEFKGVARGITETGELLVEREDGMVSAIYSGEVSVRGIYGYV